MSKSTTVTKRKSKPKARKQSDLKARERRIERAQALKRETIDHYGGKCSCKGCNETELVMLTIDHVFGGGNEHRRKLFKRKHSGGGGESFYRWLKANNWPEGFRVLCFNCNYAHHRLGYCPHTRKKGKK